MTGFASGREARRQVIGISGIVIIILVTGVAIDWGTGISVGVTVEAFQGEMGAG
ncbi:MAG: hypothetical protein GWN61_17130 [candidate division Zixibacteria bacterium]|nr:hypothetical protein [candidate division Zixibacteria bacterium]NIU15680.1 hypothetical protein [candidate division Zixibacteria bacterium]NIV07845.1 hypothetical protein [candidate division Zixibacteria bacterium]